MNKIGAKNTAERLLRTREERIRARGRSGGGERWQESLLCFETGDNRFFA